MPNQQVTNSTLTGMFGPALAQAGISLDNPCDVGALTEMISEDTKAFIQEAPEEVQKLSAEGGGAMFLALMVVILENVLNMATGTALAYANQLYSAAAGGMMGAMYAGVALALTSVDGLQLIVAYFGAIALKNALQKHNEISRVVDADVKILIIFTQNLIEFFTPQIQSSSEYAALRVAMEELKVAAKLLGIEYGKVTSGGAAVSGGNIASAQRRVTRCLDALTGGTYGQLDASFADAINEGLPNSAGTILNFGNDEDSWMPLIGRIESAITTDLFSDLSFAMDGDEFDQALGERLGTLEVLTGKIFPLLPEFAQLVFVQLFVGNSIDRLMARVPILAGILNNFSDWMTDRLDPPQEIRDLIPPEPGILDTPQIIQDDPKITYKRATTAVKMFEAALLLGPNYFNFIKGMAGIAAGVLEPSISKINKVRAEMKQTDQEIQAQQIGTISMAGLKVGWGLDLLEVNALLSSLAPTVVVNEDDLDIQEVVAYTQAAGEKLTNLKEYIKSQNLTSSGTIRTRPAEDVHEVAQKYLTPLAASQLVLLSPSVASRTLAGAHALTLLLGKQRGENVALLHHVNSFIGSVEALPNFEQLKSLYDQILASLGGGPFADLADSLANGDLSELAGQLDTISAITDVAELGLCMADLEPPSVETDFIGDIEFPELPGMEIPNWSPELENAKVSKWEKWKEDSAQTISNLKDKKQALESKVDLATKIIDWVVAFSGGGA